MTYLLERQEGMGLSDDELAYLAGSMFGAGSDTVRPTACLARVGRLEYLVRLTYMRSHRPAVRSHL